MAVTQDLDMVFLAPLDDAASDPISFEDNWVWHDGAGGFEQHVWQESDDARWYENA